MRRREFLKLAPGGVVLASEMRSALAVALPAPAAISGVIWTAEQGQLREIARAPVHATGSRQVGDWNVQTVIKPVIGAQDARDITVSFRLAAGNLQSVAVGIEIAISDWSTRNFVLFPGSVYAGNRYTIVRGKYPPMVPSEFQRPDAPIIEADIARLSISPGPSFLERLIGDMSTPAVGYLAPERGEGFLLLTAQGTGLGNYGLAIEESDDRSRAWIRLTAPGIRRFRQTIDALVPSNDRGFDWKAGDEATVHFRVHGFAARRPQDLFDRLAATRKSIAGPDQPRHVLPFSATWDMLEAHFNQDNWNESWGVYMDGLPLSGPYDVSEFGWTGGGMVTQALLFDGSPISQTRARRNLDTILTGAPAPSGLFNTLFDGKHWEGEAPVPGGTALLPRGQADGLFCVLKQFNLMRARGEAIPPHWEKAIQAQANALVRTWRRAGQFGYALDSRTGDVVVGNTTSGAAIPAGLALASEWFHSADYLTVASQTAGHYASHDMEVGVTTGGPGDAPEAPDSESSYGLLQSFVTLWEVTREPRWLDFARQMGRQFASWVVSYDFKFPAGSSFARADMRTTGAVWANAQNIVPPPSICCASGDALFRLFRATGDRFFLDLVRDIAHGIPQYYSRQDRRYRCGNEGKMMPPSWIYERVQTSDWEVPGTPVGEVPCASADWISCAMMLTWIEIPGLYVQPDSGLVCAIDHVDARLIRQTAGAALIELHNPTSFPARIRVFAESRAAARQPLPLNALLKRPVITIFAGDRVRIRVDSDGRATPASV
jgi:hypothetical protein